MSNLKTSDKITFVFTMFTFISLIILLIGVNIIYFFAWYTDQKTESMYDMNMNYSEYASSKNETNLESFKEYILQKDTLIIPLEGEEIVCSVGVENKIHKNIDLIKDDYFYNDGEKTYFIFSQFYEGIGEVKVFFDTTPYVKSQILIIKISLIIIFFITIIYYFIARRMSKIAFEKMRQFITDVSHEFKTPLMIINSEIDLYNKKLEKGKLGKNDIKILHKKIKEKTVKLNDLLETFLLLSRIENSSYELIVKEIDLANYLKCITSNYIRNNELDIKIKYNLKSNIKLNIEENTFNILFENILSNAVKFSNNDLSTEGFNPLQIIEVGCDGDSFWIKDNGVGIEKTKLKEIWNKFYRNDTNKEGFGVGLFIVKRLLELYSWKVNVESEIEKGTKFIFKF